MESRSHQRPEFLGDSWFQPEQGYSYASPPSLDLTDEKLLLSENDWLKYLFIFERAKAGDRSYLHLLPDIVQRRSDPYLCSAALDLIGAAGSTGMLQALIPFMSHPVFDIRLDAYAASTLSYRLLFIEPLLKARTQHLSTERGMIENSLSKLLEPEPATICEPIGLSDAEYEELVRNTARAIEARVGTDVPVFQGEILRLERLIESIKRLIQDIDIQDYTGTLMDYLHRLEAMTGFPSVGLFDEEGNPLPLSIRVALETLAQAGILTELRPGRRYFFRHLVND